jgi:hypothetical protein
MLKYFGVSKAIGYGLMNRFWSVLAGPITMILIALSLSKIEQGYYFTFASLLALQVFFELGLVTVITQFVSHEFVSLSWGDHGEIIGDEVKRNRILNILGDSLKWYFVCSFLIIITISMAGYFFFKNEPSFNISWKLPWLLAVVGVGINLLIIPFYAVISGSGDVASVNFRELIGGILGSLLGWSVLYFGGGLYAISAVTFGTIIVGVIYLIKSKLALLKQGIYFALNKIDILNPVSWKHEIWPMQWRIAVSWVSGYFIFQLFVPILFKFHGPVVAGQMGMTLSATNAILGICMIWPISKMPEFGKLIAQKNWISLDSLFNKTLKQSIVICLLLVIALLFVLLVMNTISNVREKFLPIWQIVIFTISIFGQVLVNNWAIYMRAHKKEPMVYLTIIAAFLIAISSFIAGYYYSSFGIILGYVLINICYGVPLTYILFKKFKITNHS